MTDVGRIEMPAYLTADGNWLLVGTFYPLDRDPREVRMELIDLDRLPGTGPNNAPVVIVEFSDYQCPSCGKHQVDIDEALAKYPGKVRLYHVDHPIIRIHPWAFPAAAGSRCVEKMVGEKAYWQYKKAIYERQKDITAENLDDISAPIVESLGADVAAWRKCRDEDASVRAAILGDLKMSNRVGVHGTPTLFVNGTLVDLGIDEVLDTAIRRALAGK
jgi:protein-disulfide isomerase